MKSNIKLTALLLLVSITFGGIELVSADATGFTARVERDKYPRSFLAEDGFYTAFIVMPGDEEVSVYATAESRTPVSKMPENLFEPHVRYLGRMRNIPVGLLYIPMYEDGHSLDAVNVRVSFQSAINTAEIYVDSPIYDDVLDNVFLNYIVLPRMLPDGPGHYVVICPEFAKDALAPLLEYRREMGYKIDFNLLEDIGDTPSKDDILAFLQDKYETLTPTPDLVMLVGDEDFPDGGGLPDYSWIEPGRTPFASDNRYAMFDDEDYIPDVMLGRLTVDTELQLRTLVTKMLSYEKDPFAGGSEWLERGLMVASYLHATTPPMNALWVRELMMRNGFTEVDTLFDRLGMRISTEQVSHGFNEGVSWIDYRGWGASTGWWEPEFKIPDVYELENAPNYPVVATVVCGTADFRSLTDPSFAEVLLHAGTPSNPKGASAVYGPSDHDTHTRYNNQINTGFFEAPFGYGMTLISQAALFSKLSQWLYLPHERDSTVAHYFYVYNTLSDPAFPMWTGVPEELTLEAPDTLKRSGESFDVSISPAVAGVAVCLYKHNDSLQAFGVTDESGTATIRLEAGVTSSATLTAWKKGYVPVQKDVFVRYYDHALIEVTDITIDDDDDGILNSGERANLIVTLNNTGDPTPIELWRLTSNVPDLIVYRPSERAIADGEFTLSFEIGMNMGAHLEHPILLQLSGVNGEEERYLFDLDIPHDTGKLEITDYSWTGDYGLDMPSTINFTLMNAGDADFTYSDFIAISESPYIGIADPDIWVPDIPAGESVDLDFGVIPKGVYGVNGRIRIEDRNGELVGYIDASPETGGPSGPDLAGYIAFDIEDDGYPEDLSWLDISSTGTPHTMSDDRTTVVDIPFEFGFYGESYTQLSLCSNGWVGPGAQSYFLIDFYNLPIPGSSGPFGVLAPYWNDLEPSRPSDPNIYTYHDSEAGIYYIQYNHFNNRGYSDNQLFQIQIHDHPVGDDEIAFIYEASEDNQTHYIYSTVGIAAPDRRRGLEYRYDNIYTHNSTPFDGAWGIFFTNRTNQSSLNGTVYPSDADVYLDYHDARRSGADFSFPILPDGTHTLQARCKGYFTFSQELDIAGETTENIEMELVPPPLDIVSETGGISWTAPDAPGRTIEGYNIYISRYKDGSFVFHDFTEETSFIPPITDDDDELGADNEDWFMISSVIDGDESFPVETSFMDIADKGQNGPEVFELIRLSPNPFNSALSIDITEGTVDIEILSADGRTVHSIEGADGTVIWNADGMPSGVYTVRAMRDNLVKSKRALLIK